MMSGPDMMFGPDMLSGPGMMSGNQQNSRLLLDRGFCEMIALASFNSFSFSILKMGRANMVNQSVCMRNHQNV